MKHLLYEKKFPTTSDNYVGIEIEFLLLEKQTDKLQDALVKANLQFNVNYGRDGSVKDTEFVPEYGVTNDRYRDRIIKNIDKRYEGKEIRILATEIDLPIIIEKVCEIIKSYGGKINETCGLHVHLDMRNRNIDHVFNNFYFSQNLLFATQPKARAKGEFCKVLRTRTIPPQSRYYGINRLAYNRLRTLEIRMHDGSIDATEIKMWTGLLLKIANRKDTFKRQLKTFDDLMLPETLKGYLNVRVKKYA